VMDQLKAEWHKSYSHTQRRYSVWVSKQLLSTEEHFITPAVLPGCRRSNGGSRWKWLFETGVCAILISGKFPQFFHTCRTLSVEQQ